MNTAQEWTEDISGKNTRSTNDKCIWEQRFWTKNYRAPVPKTIDDQLNEIPSMVELIRRDVEKFSERTGFVSIGTELTYGEMYTQAETFAAWLQNIGIKKGDRVAIMMPNCLQYPIALFGTLMAGAVVVNVNPLYTPAELHHQLQDSGAKAIVVMEMFGKTLQSALPDTDIQHILITAMGDMLKGITGFAMTAATRYIQRMVPPYELLGSFRWKSTMKKAKKLQFLPVQIEHNDLAFLQYTGGTTGVAKGAMLSHKNVVANSLQGRAWVIDQLEKMDTENFTNITLLPLYHVFSLTSNLLMFTGVGGRNILIANPRDARMVQFILRNENFQGFCGINTLFSNFLENKDFCNRDFSGLKVVISGGMATQHEIAERWETVTGKPVVEGYGLTECSPVVCVGMIDLEKPERMKYTGKVGYPLPSTEVRLRRDDGSWADIGEPGELCVRGPQVMQGYWKRPEETEEVIDTNGWLATGDMAIMYETGEVKIVDRIKDMILVSGFNVYPTEVEDVVTEHPDIIEAAAIGIPDPVYGEKLKIIVVPRNPALSQEEVISFCRERLTGYKIPKILEFRLEELPKSNVGKILRRELK